MAEAVRKAGVKHMLLPQLPLLPGRAPGQGADRHGRARQDLPFPRPSISRNRATTRGAAGRRWYASGTKSGILLGIGSHIIDMSRFLAGRDRGVERPRAHLQHHAHVARRRSRERDRGRRKPGAGGVRQRRHGHARILGCGHRAPQPAHLGDQRLEGQHGLDLEDPNHLQVFIDGRRRRRCGASPMCRSPTPAIRCRPSTSRSATTRAGSTATSMRCTTSWTASPNDKPVAPYGATFEDGYRCQVIMEAIVRSSRTGAQDRPRVLTRMDRHGPAEHHVLEPTSWTRRLEELLRRRGAARRGPRSRPGQASTPWSARTARASPR